MQQPRFTFPQHKPTFQAHSSRNLGTNHQGFHLNNQPSHHPHKAIVSEFNRSAHLKPLTNDHHSNTVDLNSGYPTNKYSLQNMMMTSRCVPPLLGRTFL
ncbi:unnamed protein product, partial [Iphiclides podalirius]